MTYCGSFQHYPFRKSGTLGFCYCVISVHGTCTSKGKSINRICQHSDTQFLLHYTLLFASLGWLSAAEILHAENTRKMPSVYLRSSLSKIVYNVISQTAVSSHVSISWEQSGQAELSCAMHPWKLRKNDIQLSFIQMELSIPLSSFTNITSSSGLWVTSLGLLGFHDVPNQVPNVRQTKRMGYVSLNPVISSENICNVQLSQRQNIWSKSTPNFPFFPQGMLLTEA